MWMLRFAQHDKSGVIPSQSEESSAWMLHFVQHDKSRSVIPSQSEESIHGCFATLSMTGWKAWMLHCTVFHSA